MTIQKKVKMTKGKLTVTVYECEVDGYKKSGWAIVDDAPKKVNKPKED